MRSKKGGNTNKAINILLDILIGFFGIVLLITIYNWVQVKILDNDYSSFFGYSIFEVQTNSMADTINAGDWIIVKYSKKYDLNDIVTFKEDGNFITHRVVNIYNGTFITKGDANNAKDDEIDQEQIIGKVVKILPNFGILRSTLFNPFVLIMLIVTLYLINITCCKNKSKRVDDVMKKFIQLIKNIFKKGEKKKLDNLFEDDTLDTIVNPKVDETVDNEVKIDEIQVSDFVEDDTMLIPNVDEVANQVTGDEDLDKTMFFRMIPVDKEELEKVYRKKDIEVLEEEMPKPEKVVEVEEEKENLIEENLEMLQNRKKKFKNIIEKVMYIKEDEIREILDILNNKEKLRPNEATIRDYFIKTYIDGKYYNYCGNVNVEYNKKNMFSRLELVLKDANDDLISKYKGSDTKFDAKAYKYLKFFNLILRLEVDYLADGDIDNKREVYLKRFNKYLNSDDINDDVALLMINDILKIQRVHKGMIKTTLSKAETTMFDLKYNRVSGKNLYGLELVHNIKFSQVYSDYIIDKTYSDGVIAEDKIAVLLNILMAKMAVDMLKMDFSKKYILYIPESLYLKDNKLDKIFGMFDDEFAKNNIIVLIQFNKLINNKKTIRSLIKEGYHFATDMGDFKEIKDRDLSCVQIMDYIFVNRKALKEKSLLPKEFDEKIIYDDIENKIGNYWGE